jgi:lysozyme
MIQLLLKRYFALPRNIKIAILLTGFLSIISLIIWGIYAIVMLFRPNPNGWEKVSKVGISMPLRYEVHGIDVSHHNGEINWKKSKRCVLTITEK